jgi:hypothetical protein
MTDLSPAAKAVIDAAMNTPMSPDGPLETRRLQVAAALRAAADQVVPESYAPSRTAFYPEAQAFVDGKECRNESVRYQLLAIATELEADR